MNTNLIGGFNPSESILVKPGNLPQIGMNIKNLGNHHPEMSLLETSEPQPKKNIQTFISHWSLNTYPVGGRTNPLEKCARQIASFPQIGMNI